MASMMTNTTISTNASTYFNKTYYDKKYDALSLAIISALLVGVVGYVIGKIF